MQRNWSICLSLILVCSCSHALAQQNNEINILLRLKSGFRNPSKLQSWNTSRYQSPCQGWYGITCDTSSRIIGIHLSKSSLGGIIHGDIMLLTYLTYLDLSNNDITGDIPGQGWNNFKALQNISLNGNMLSGPIPSGLSDAPRLQRIRLDYNNISGIIPPQLFDKTTLKAFSVVQNNISGPIPYNIGNCGSLRTFYAFSNHLSGSIPDSIGNLTQLVKFEVQNNHLSGSIPDSIGNLTQLVKFEVQNNQLSGSLPASLANLNLTSFNVSNNNLNGSIPGELSTKFNASSFLANPGLCGYPLTQTCENRQNAIPPTNPLDDPRPVPPKKSSRLGVILGSVIGSVCGAMVLFLVIVAVYRRSKKPTVDPIQAQNWFSQDINSTRRRGRFEMFRRSFKYTYDEIVANAGFFDTAHVLGKGRFATVYRSKLPDNTQMAVKVFKSPNTPPQFEKELHMLALIKHQNILSIKGYYSNPAEKAIFYDYVPGSTLYDLLHNGANRSTLADWSIRHKIALGVAKAIEFLHRQCGYRIIHRDLKSTNVLLDTDFEAKVADFGMVHMVCGNSEVVETPGYTAPEVLKTKKYTEKSDVYSFGVVLLELITGQKPVSYVREKTINMTTWVLRLHSEQRDREVIDPTVLRTCAFPECIDRALSLALLCIDENQNTRPSITEVISILQGLCPVLSPLRSPEMAMERPLLPSSMNGSGH